MRGKGLHFTQTGKITWGSRGFISIWLDFHNHLRTQSSFVTRLGNLPNFPGPPAAAYGRQVWNFWLIFQGHFWRKMNIGKAFWKQKRTHQSLTEKQALEHNNKLSAAEENPGSSIDNLGSYLQPEKLLKLIRVWNYFIHSAGNFKGKF